MDVLGISIGNLTGRYAFASLNITMTRMDSFWGPIFYTEESYCGTLVENQYLKLNVILCDSQRL